MKIAIVGYGRMGKAIERIAKEKGHRIAAIVDPVAGGATAKKLSRDAIGEADVCIDFTSPDVALENIGKYCEAKKNAVIGTTGWHDRAGEVKKAVEKAGIGLVFASNFSIGINAFYRIIGKAAEVMDKLPDYDVLCYEMHHRGKKDSPSGTAKALEKILLEKISRKNEAVEDRLGRKISANEMHFASVRGGSVPGTHAVLFDSDADTIELRHVARNREGFAAGAVLAAEFVGGKKGFFTIDNLMDYIFSG